MIASASVVPHAAALDGLLSGLTILEAASFVAAPTCALNLLQLGAEVIRLDPIGGGPDFARWPRAANGASLYWEGLNKGKKSVTIDLRVAEGRELAKQLAVAVGMLVTNFPADGFLAHREIERQRGDMISVRIMGWSDGANALDYTVNAALGVPYLTGPPSLGDAPVNHVLPAWDLAAGNYAAFALLAAERRRQRTGQGAEIKIALGDVAIAALSNLGWIGEAATTDVARPRYGNDLYGAFGRDFATADGHRVMVTAITPKQWQGLLDALEISDAVGALEAELGLSFAGDEGLRFDHRDRLNAIVGAAIGRRVFADASARFEARGVTWAAYRLLVDALREDPRLSTANPVLSEVEHLSGCRYLTAGAPAALMGADRLPSSQAPRLGEHSEELLVELLGLSSGQFGDLVDRAIVGVARA